MWCIPELTDDFIERMMDILELYERPYNSKEPVVCFDEKNKQLLAHKRNSIPMNQVCQNGTTLNTSGMEQQISF
jgi:hypothetical protein